MPVSISPTAFVITAIVLWLLAGLTSNGAAGLRMIGHAMTHGLLGPFAHFLMESPLSGYISALRVGKTKYIVYGKYQTDGGLSALAYISEWFQAAVDIYSEEHEQHTATTLAQIEALEESQEDA